MSRATQTYNASLNEEQTTARRAEWEARKGYKMRTGQLCFLAAPIIELEVRPKKNVPQPNVNIAHTRRGARESRNFNFVTSVSKFRGLTYVAGATV